MEWRDQGLIIGVKKYGETSVILEAMTLAHGRHFGLVRGGRSRRMQPMLQPGNQVALTWRARLEDHLGLYLVELVEPRAARLMASAAALSGFNLVAALLRLLAERDPHPQLYEAASLIVDRLDDASLTPALLVRLELALLAELGFGLDLARCAATGATEDLIYVSPKTGRAVSREAGAPYREKLLRLPDFLRSDIIEPPGASDLADGFALTAYFLERDVFGPRGLDLPGPRRAYLAAVVKAQIPKAGPVLG
ncbi:MAG TPA: DNA repair protein RecO [Methylovirgula sp.]|nr:DNA repair protein RecO [Methylovirgula sp.]